MSSKKNRNGESIEEIDPEIVYFTFSRIRPRFSCGRRVEDTLKQLISGEVTPADLPTLSVLFDGTHYYSLNNRRLYCFKQLKALGKLVTVQVRVRPVPQTRRMQEKYTPEKCALQATLKREQDRDAAGGNNNNNNNSNNNSGPAQNGSSEDEEDENNDNDNEDEGSVNSEEKNANESKIPHRREEEEKEEQNEEKQNNKKKKKKEKKNKRKGAAKNASSSEEEDDEDAPVNSGGKTNMNASKKKQKGNGGSSMKASKHAKHGKHDSDSEPDASHAGKRRGVQSLEDQLASLGI